MFERGMIQSRGFQNLVEDGRVTGFQVRIRTTYYRGVWASMIEWAEVTVDGETFPREKVTWTFGGRTFTPAQLEKASDVRWQYEDAATLTIPKAGGLRPGLHDVQVSFSIRASYMGPPERHSRLFSDRRKVVLLG